MVRLSQID